MLFSDGTNKPCRCERRAPGFADLEAMDFISSDHMLIDIATIPGSLDVVSGEVNQ